MRPAPQTSEPRRGIRGGQGRHLSSCLRVRAAFENVLVSRNCSSFVARQDSRDHVNSRWDWLSSACLIGPYKPFSNWCKTVVFHAVRAPVDAAKPHLSSNSGSFWGERTRGQQRISPPETSHASRGVCHHFLCFVFVTQCIVLIQVILDK